MSNPNSPQPQSPSAQLLNELSRITMRYNLMDESGMEVYDVLSSPPGELRPVYNTYFPTRDLDIESRLIRPQAKPGAVPERPWSVEYIPNWVARQDIGDIHFNHRINFWEADPPSQTVARTIFNVEPRTGTMRTLLELEVGGGERTEERARLASEFVVRKIVQTRRITPHFLQPPEILASRTWEQMLLASEDRIAFDAITDKFTRFPAKPRLKQAVAIRLSEL